MFVYGDIRRQKQAIEFYCKHCEYKTCKKINYNSHLSTDKHKRLTEDLQMRQKQAQNKLNQPETFICSCSNQYQHRQSLWKHKKKCSFIKNELANETNQQQLVEYLLKENSEFKQLMLEQNKQMIDLAKKSAGHHNNNTTNNTNFNLQFYLNETCKNAMNIMDFVSQLQVGITELEETGRLGYAEGISKIFINELKQINVNDRPIHCSDSKRETLYIKNNNEWNKEWQDKVILTNAIKHVAHKNMKQITEWKKDHTDYNDSKSKENDKYLQIVSESMSGSTKEETNKNYNKIIKNIVKETIIEK